MPPTSGLKHFFFQCPGALPQAFTLGRVAANRQCLNIPPLIFNRSPVQSRVTALTCWITNTIFRYGGFATFDNSRINDSSSNAVFSWSNDTFTMTENTTTSSNIRNNYDSGFYGEMFGSGSGWAESSRFAWTKDSHQSGSGASETTKTYTVDQGNIEWV